jgi:uncharacterized protein (TIGR02145 family)
MSFKEIEIGNQSWMSKNLNTSAFMNGDPIPEVKTAKEWEKAGKARKPAWCYFENKESNGKKFGKLYNWYAIIDPRGIVPDGWVIPNEEMFLELIDNLSGEDEAPMKLKSTSGWIDQCNGNNLSGFNAMPGGFRNADGNFYELKEVANWWTLDENDKEWAYYYWVDYKNSLRRSVHQKANGYSVRCIKRSESTLKTKYSANISKNVYPLSAFLDSSLVRTENHILENSLELQNFDLSTLEKDMITKDIDISNVRTTLESLKKGSDTYIQCNFFEIFNPELLFTIYCNNIKGFLQINFSKDPTDYIYEEYGNLNKNLILTIDSNEGNLLVDLEREYSFEYDDIEDSKILKQIHKLEKNSKSDKKWKSFIVTGKKKLNYIEFNKKFTNHFKITDLWL